MRPALLVLTCAAFVASGCASAPAAETPEPSTSPQPLPPAPPHVFDMTLGPYQQIGIQAQRAAWAACIVFNGAVDRVTGGMANVTWATPAAPGELVFGMGPATAINEQGHGASPLAITIPEMGVGADGLQIALWPFVDGALVATDISIALRFEYEGDAALTVDESPCLLLNT